MAIQKSDVPKELFVCIEEDGNDSHEKILCPARLLQSHASLEKQRVVGEYELKRVLLLEDAVSQWSEI